LILDVSGYFASRPAATPAPVVWIAGDSLVAAWGTLQQQANPTWAFYAPPVDPATGGIDPADETSGALLARMQTLIAATLPAAYPEYLVILVGTYDMAAPGWEGPCGDGVNGDSTVPAAANTCANLAAIYTLAHAQGIKVLLCTPPLTTDAGPAGAALTSLVTVGEILMDRYIEEAEEGGGGGILDEFVQIEGSIEPNVDLGTYVNIAWTDDGLNPNATGAAVFTATTQATISALAQVSAQEQASGVHLSAKQRNEAVQAIIKAQAR
jgi:hypothetical protein